ncbi:MAG: S8 family serine peptidase, partial [Bacteroidia bacterium]|nr:S8 family serine peptidase [Bacteroidia bacterium]
MEAVSLIDFIDTYNISKIDYPFARLVPELEKVYLVEFAPGYNVNAVISEFKALSFIEYAEKVNKYTYFLIPDDSYFNSQWHLHKIQAQYAWNIVAGAEDIVVAITDNGTYYDHSDLSANIWINQPEALSYAGLDTEPPFGTITVSELITQFGSIENAITGLSNSADEDTNGYVDDIIGWDSGMGDNDPINISDTNFEAGHGTHVAGIVGAVSNNGTGIASISFNTKLMIVKNGNENSEITDITAINSIIYARIAGADIINMSWGGTAPNSSLETALNTAFADSIILVAAAGNDGNDSLHYPASYPNVISVGASDISDLKAGFSCFGSTIDVMAPGVGILSTVTGSPDALATHQGTSMASPLVAGLCALMKSLDPSKTPDEIRTCLESTCDPMPNETFYDTVLSQSKVGHGRINAFKAVACISGEPIPYFSVNTQVVCSGNTATFTDESLNFPTSWDWLFPSGTPSSATGAGPHTVTYDSAGSYNVALIVSVGIDSNEIVQSNFINVTDCPSIFSDQGTWYFGYYAALNFSSGSPVQIPSPMYAREGCASVTNPTTGQVIFYTNGQDVYRSDYTKVLNFGDKPLLDDVPPSNFASPSQVLAVPDPANSNQYYIFYNHTQTYISYYAIYDISSELLVSIDNLIPGNFLVSELVAGVPHCSENAYWIIERQYDDPNYEFLSFYLDDQGIFYPIISPGFSSSALLGNIDVSKDGKRISVSIWPSGTYIYDFDCYTGKMVEIGNTPVNFMYSAAFSPSGDLLYGASFNKLYQFDLSDLSVCNNDIPYMEISYYMPHFWVPFQLGPDNKMYLSGTIATVENLPHKTLSVIIFPDSINTVNNPNKCGLVPDYFEFDPYTYCYMGLPNMIDADTSLYPDYPDFEFCVTNCGETHFHAFGCGTVIGWDFDFDPVSPYFTNADTTHPTYTYLNPGTYTVALLHSGTTDTIFHNVVIELPPIPQITPDNDYCDQDIAMEYSTNISDSVEYQWSVTGGIISGDSTQQNVFINLDPPGGIISLVITDPATGCTNSNADTITVFPNPVISITPDLSLCFGDTTILSSSGGTSCEWFPPAGLNDIYNCNPVASPVVTTTYTAVITDTNGCTDSDEMTITVNPQFEDTLIITEPVCYGYATGSVTATILGGTSPFSYFWSTGNTTNYINSLQAGTYFVTITDSGGCIHIDSATIIQPTVITIMFAGTDSVNCFNDCNGLLTTNISGGNPSYSYNWSTGDSTSFINNLCAGNYYLTITDASNCSIVDSIYILEPQLLTVEITGSENVECFDQCNGEATSVITGGIAPYTCLWNDQYYQNTPNADSLCSGQYSIIVTDNNGCMASDSVSITEPLQLTSSVTSIVHNSCYGEATGSVIVTASGGTQPLTYLWTTGDITNNTDSLPDGVYYLTITDAEGCIKTDSATITQPSPITVSITEMDSVSCYEYCNAQLIVNATGGTPGYSYHWSNNDTSATADSLCAGWHSVTITDANNCTSVDSIALTQPGNLTSSFTAITDVICYGECSGIATVQPSGGTLPYNYSWMNGEISYTADSLCADWNYVTITDANGCTISDSTVIGQASEIIVSFADSTCTDTCKLIFVQATGGTPGYNYNWPSGDSAISETLCPGNYTVTVSDANSCEVTNTVNITD